MSEATLIYPHQLFETSPALTPDRPVYVVEEPLLLTHNPIHRSKLLLHKLTLDAYHDELVEHGYTVTRLTIHDHPTTTSVFDRLHSDGIRTIHVADTTDAYLEAELQTADFDRVWYESPLFILTKDDAITRFLESGRHMARFYAALRKDRHILVDDHGKPQGGKWSFDTDNRKRIPKQATLPTDITLTDSPEITAAIAWVDSVTADTYGTCNCWLPYTRTRALEYVDSFFAERFRTFGDYEDAIHTGHVRLWHSTLSPLLNIGLITPTEIITAAIECANNTHIPLNSLEGFIRQIIGWREFMRASYECDGTAMRTSNFFNHTTPLPDSFWNGTTGLPPLDHTIETALQYGYTHHIERLMVIGNGMLLCQIDPDDVYRWFMAMYIDAYDWVMVPNVYGMSQFADGGSFATKPYISGANYLRKMSNYPTGDWEQTWTGLYWHFIATHYDTFAVNPRMHMMTRLLDRMDTEKRATHSKTATAFLAQLTTP